MTSPHTYACPLRWGDLDMLGHTNNVRYLDYVGEARTALLAAAGLPVEGPHRVRVDVRRQDVSFDAPLMFREAPVTVESVVVDAAADLVVLEQSVVDRPGEGAVPGSAGAPRVYFRARTELTAADASGAPRPWGADELDGLSRFGGTAQEPPLRPEVAADLVPVRADTVPAGATSYPVRVRWRDVSADGRVGDEEFVEYLQEARLRMLGLERWLGHGDASMPAGGFDNLLVVARTSVRHVRAAHFRLEPYEVLSWVSRIGGASFDVTSVIRDPLREGSEAVLGSGRVVLVAFDAREQRSAELTQSSRGVLESLRG
ncbi:acyl-[acyl-carrier-protein] thioesterase [Nocardioidaceae bacterium]|nr:acyl-[acyl-carrier-protein] thioesterase [Nocardioidaceae bacterium]